ncbi:Hydroxypyruvate reductase [subsurface metagenome]
MKKIVKFKVAVTDYVFPNLEIEKRELKKIGADLIESAGKDEENIIEAAKDADAILNCYAELTPRVIESLEKCQIIARYGIGVNNVNMLTATKKGIIVTNVPDYCIEEVSDHALALILACARKICQLNKTVKSGKWEFKDYHPIYRLKGQTLGIVSFGKIPRRLVEKVRAYEFNIISYDPYVNKEIVAKYNVKLVTLEELLKESDIITVHAPLTKETEGMFGSEQFKLMKNSAYLINTARGGLIKDNDLAQALKKGEISGAGLDVLEDENVNSHHPLVNLENVIITPHSAFYSEEALKDLQYKAVQEVVRVLTGEKPKSCVNPEVLKK